MLIVRALRVAGPRKGTLTRLAEKFATCKPATLRTHFAIYSARTLCRRPKSISRARFAPQTISRYQNSCGTAKSDARVQRLC